MKLLLAMLYNPQLRSFRVSFGATCRKRIRSHAC